MWRSHAGVGDGAWRSTRGLDVPGLPTVGADDSVATWIEAAGQVRRRIERHGLHVVHRDAVSAATRGRGATRKAWPYTTSKASRGRPSAPACASSASARRRRQRGVRSPPARAGRHCRRAHAARPAAPRATGQVSVTSPGPSPGRQIRPPPACRPGRACRRTGACGGGQPASPYSARSPSSVPGPKVENIRKPSTASTGASAASPAAGRPRRASPCWTTAAAACLRRASPFGEHRGVAARTSAAATTTALQRGRRGVAPRRLGSRRQIHCALRIGLRQQRGWCRGRRTPVDDALSGCRRMTGSRSAMRRATSPCSQGGSGPAASRRRHTRQRRRVERAAGAALGGRRHRHGGQYIEPMLRRTARCPEPGPVRGLPAVERGAAVCDGLRRPLRRAASRAAAAAACGWAAPPVRCGACLREPPPFEHTVCASTTPFPGMHSGGFKFHGRAELAGAGRGACSARFAARRAADADLVLPVPLAPRGWPSAATTRPGNWHAGTGGARRWAWPPTRGLLLRPLDQAHQADLNRAERQRNLRRRFMTVRAGRGERAGPVLALVDDVMTTGATAAEAARRCCAPGRPRWTSVGAGAHAGHPAPLPAERCSTSSSSHPEIPPNTGNVIRLAANTGCTLHLVEPLGFSMDDKLLRAPGWTTTSTPAVRRHAVWAALLRPKQPDPRRCFAFTTGAAGLRRGGLAGRRLAGLRQRERRACRRRCATRFPPAQRVRLPMRAGQRSLNLSNAVAVAVFEAWRQHELRRAAVAQPVRQGHRVTGSRAARRAGSLPRLGVAPGAPSAADRLGRGRGGLPAPRPRPR
jgi:tRNA (cytidine/uridine-2'-O-)-methyltransferase